MEGTLIDPLLRTKVFWCSECEKAASKDAWQDAWWRVRSFRMASEKFTEEEYGKDFGLDDRMICPRCNFIHADDDCSGVDELDALVVPIEEPSYG